MRYTCACLVQDRGKAVHVSVTGLPHQATDAAAPPGEVWSVLAASQRSQQAPCDCIPPPRPAGDWLPALGRPDPCPSFP